MSNHIKQITLPNNTTYDIVTPYNLTIGNKVFNGSAEVVVEAKDMGLGNAMRYIGTTTTAIVDDATTNPITIGGKSVTAVSGDVIIYNTQEFIWNGSKWEEFGAPLATSGVTPGTYGPSANVTGSNNATMNVPEITVDAYGRVTAITNRVYTAKNTADTDKKTASSNTSSKIFLVGATTQSTSGQTTYSHDTIYIGTDGHLYDTDALVATQTYVNDAIASAIITALNANY